jgi:hypothetical protein
MKNAESYNKKLNELFEKWEKEFEFSHFFCDGLMYRGEILKNDTGTPFWRRSGNEDELWDKTQKRVMFLLKDVNANGDSNDDIRGLICKGTKSPMFKRMSYWLYGLLKTTENGRTPDYNTFTNEESTHFFDDTPVAYVNCKKEAGTSSVTPNTLHYYMKRDKNFIIDQVKILDPDIILCCAWAESTDNPILKFIKENVYQDLEQVNGWMYYSEKDNKLVINSYHPSTRKSNDKYTEMYNNMMAAYKEFIDKYPDFLKNNTR